MRAGILRAFAQIATECTSLTNLAAALLLPIIIRPLPHSLALLILVKLLAGAFAFLNTQIRFLQLARLLAIILAFSVSLIVTFFSPLFVSFLTLSPICFSLLGHLLLRPLILLLLILVALGLLALPSLLPALLVTLSHAIFIARQFATLLMTLRVTFLLAPVAPRTGVLLLLALSVAMFPFSFLLDLLATLRIAFQKFTPLIFLCFPPNPELALDCIRHQPCNLLVA
mmetsp:Transcript_82192/g.228034  ORF Transcript_82192/g.228034 Transcript_82192/m.228034 type:complete len:227 (+) Transcript_82192:2263-2943(+)